MLMIGKSLGDTEFYNLTDACLEARKLLVAEDEVFVVDQSKKILIKFKK